MQTTKRNRVHGTGPDRTLLKTFVKLGEVSKETIQELNDIIDQHKHNDIGGDVYSITKTVDYENTHGVKGDFYRQILLQKKANEDNMPTAVNGVVFNEYEELYTRWDTEKYSIQNTITDISKYFNSICRFRLSETQPHNSIAWHIDTNTSVMCRAQICVNDNDSLFEFKDRQGLKTLQMKPGELWFINTGWNHRVVSQEMARRTAVFSFKFENLIDGSNTFI